VKRRRALHVSAGSAAAAAAVAAAACVPGTSETPSVGDRPALVAPVTYAALGASDTAGIGVEDPQRDSWVAVLTRQLPQPARLINLGIPGVRLFEALEVELPPALEAKPQLITIWLVVNDILTSVPLDRYRADLDRLLAALRNGTGAKVAIGNVPNAPDSLPYLGLPPAERRIVADTWNAAIAASAAAHGATLVDLFRRWPLREHPEYIGPDRLHPTVIGYRTLAETFRTVLSEERII
jgi:lysophospholipase L1-like esterase